MRVAREFVDQEYADQLLSRGGDFWEYDGTCWPEIDEERVRTAAYRWLEDSVYEKEAKGVVTLEPWDPTRHKLDNLLDAVKAVVYTGKEAPCWARMPRSDAPPATEIVSMSNGLLHVPTRTLYDHTPSFLTHHGLPFDFDPSAPDPERWLAFLEQIWSDDPSSIDALQEVFGYILGGDTRLQKIPMMVGPRRAGKGTIARVATGLLGPHNVAAPTMASLSTNFGLQPLIGKPLAIISDARLSGRTNASVVVERLLSISGEDSLTIDRKYREPWTGRLPTRFLILTNELPELTDSSGALASRFLVFVLTKSFLGQEDPDLTDKLLAEASGIFNWALEGLDRLRERGRFELPESGKAAIRELEDLSSPVSAFVRDRCIIASDESVPVDELWSAWKTWCEEQNVGRGTKAVFGRNLKATAPAVQKARPREGDVRMYVYDGIGLNPKKFIGDYPDHPDHEDRSGQRSGSGPGSRSGQTSHTSAGGPSGPGNSEVISSEQEAELDLPF